MVDKKYLVCYYRTRNKKILFLQPEIVMHKYEKDYPHVAASTYAGDEFPLQKRAKLTVVEVRAKTPNGGGGDRIAVVELTNPGLLLDSTLGEQRLVPYGRLTHARNANIEIKELRAYMQMSWDQGQPLDSETPFVQIRQRLKGDEDQLPLPLKPKTKKKLPATPAPALFVDETSNVDRVLAAVTRVQEIAFEINNDPVLRRVWDNLNKDLIGTPR